MTQSHQVYVFDRLPHHLAPLHKGVAWVVERGVRHLAVVIALIVLQRVALRPLPGARPAASRPDAARLLTRFAWGAEALSVTGLAIEAIGWGDPAWSASLLRYYWFRLADVAASLAVASLAMRAVALGLRGGKPWAPVLGVTLGLAAAVQVGVPAAKRLANPVAEADAYAGDARDWVAMCEWVRENTPQDALFLVPRRSHSFKWRAHRPEVVTYKDVPQDAQGLLEWRRRYEDVYRVGQWPDGSPRWARSVARLGAERLKELAAKYGADYALSRDVDAEGKPWPTSRASLPVVHRVGALTLYDLRPWSAPRP